METKPIKRNINLVPLSKDHHFGLLACWKIKRGIETNIVAERITKYILFFWENYLKTHFNEEETLLFELIEDDKITAAKKQHELIRHKIIELAESKNEGYNILEDLAAVLKDHIRYEERILFPFLERTLTNAQLEMIGATLNGNQTNPSIECYPDDFWVRSPQTKSISRSI